MTVRNDTFSGTWYGQFWYPNADDSGEDMTKDEMTAHQMGNELILQSEPNEEGSYMFVRLTLDDDVATGAWHETTSQSGTFEGATYNGTGQLVLSADRQSMEGAWAGVGVDRTSQQKRVYTGRWKFSRAED